MRDRLVGGPYVFRDGHEGWPDHRARRAQRPHRGGAAIRGLLGGGPRAGGGRRHATRRGRPVRWPTHLQRRPRGRLPRQAGRVCRGAHRGRAVAGRARRRVFCRCRRRRRGGGGRARDWTLSPPHIRSSSCPTVRRKPCPAPTPLPCLSASTASPTVTCTHPADTTFFTSLVPSVPAGASQCGAAAARSLPPLLSPPHPPSSASPPRGGFPSLADPSGPVGGWCRPWRETGGGWRAGTGGRAGRRLAAAVTAAPVAARGRDPHRL